MRKVGLVQRRQRQGLAALGVGAERRQRRTTNLSLRCGGLCVNAPFARCARSFASGLGFAPGHGIHQNFPPPRGDKQFMTAWYCMARRLRRA